MLISVLINIKWLHLPSIGITAHSQPVRMVDVYSSNKLWWVLVNCGRSLSYIWDFTLYLLYCWFKKILCFVIINVKGQDSLVVSRYLKICPGASCHVLWLSLVLHKQVSLYKYINYWCRQTGWGTPNKASHSNILPLYKKKKFFLRKTPLLTRLFRLNLQNQSSVLHYTSYSAL